MYQMTGSDKENHAADKQAVGLSVPDVSPCSNADSSGVVVSLPSSALSGLPVASSFCTPVLGSTSLPAGIGASDLVSGATRFVFAVTRLLNTQLPSVFSTHANYVCRRG